VFVEKNYVEASQLVVQWQMLEQLNGWYFPKSFSRSPTILALIPGVALWPLHVRTASQIADPTSPKLGKIGLTKSPSQTSLSSRGCFLDGTADPRLTEESAASTATTENFVPCKLELEHSSDEIIPS
jgi:hypothetical protein